MTGESIDELKLLTSWPKAGNSNIVKSQKSTFNWAQVNHILKLNSNKIITDAVVSPPFHTYRKIVNKETRSLADSS